MVRAHRVGCAVPAVGVVTRRARLGLELAVVRILVSDPDHVEELFRKNDIAFSTTDMVVVEMNEVGRDLARVLTALLQAEGINVTRRTVAKYREDMKIPSTHQRRIRN